MKVNEIRSNMKFGSLRTCGKGYTMLNGEKYPIWICRCQCGEFVAVRPIDLISNNARCCYACKKRDEKTEESLKEFYKKNPALFSVGDIEERRGINHAKN